MTYVGGLRARLVHDNVYNLVNDALEELGWLDADRQHMPITVLAKQVDHDEQVRPNIVCVTVEDVDEAPVELGSQLTEHLWFYYIDIYAEDEVLGLHLATDIKDILNGRMSQTVTRGGPDIEIYDLTQSAATPIVAFDVSIETVQMNRARFFDKPYQKHWYAVSFHVHDFYGSEDDDG